MTGGKTPDRKRGGCIRDDLSMPLKIYYTRSWTPSQIFGVMSYTTQILQDLMSIKMSVLTRERLPVGHPAESIEPHGDQDKIRKILRIHEPMPPARLWFVEEFKFPKGVLAPGEKVYGVTPDFLTVRAGIAVISRKDHLDRDNTLDALKCSRTVAHGSVMCLAWGIHVTNSSRVLCALRDSTGSIHLIFSR